MSHCLCFMDLRATGRSASDGDEGCTPEPATASAAEETCRQAVALFRPEEGKKSSFVLQRPCALHSSSQTHATPYSSTRGAIDDDGDEDAESPPTPADEANNAGECSFAANACSEKREPLTGEASITSHTSSGDKTPQFTPDCAREAFLFGGFELISNAKTIEVHVTRSNDTTAASGNGVETYMTTCKGIPARDLEPLGAPTTYLDGNSTGSNERGENENQHGTAIQISTGECSFYKFILVSPGGPKPMERVRLKFVQSSTSCEQGAIIVRSLKVKGRLSDSIPSSNASTQQFAVSPPFPMDAASRSQEPMQSGAAGLASMMASMGGKGAMGAPAMQMMPRQKHLGPMPMQTTNLMQPQMQQQQSHEQQEKNQAELMSSIAGLGMFLKSSEERTMKRLESLINGLETRMTKRLDGLEERLGAIEEILKPEGELGDTCYENE